MPTLHSLAQNAMLGADPEALLVSAARTGIAELGGFIPVTIEAGINACPTESRPQMPEKAAGLLKRILAGEFEATLPEFLQLAGAGGFVAPPETLPALLGLGRKELRPLALPVLGERGRWLAGFNPSWAYALAPVDESAWETGKTEERVTLLERLRATAPGQARELVKSTWQQDPPEARAAFLVTFSAALSMEDESFIESCLDDKRKEVREAAQNLLLRLPESRLVKRMAARLEPLLTLKSRLLGKDTLEVSLPEALDAAAKRDGVSASILNKQWGEKANLLAQMLALMPPALWSAKWKRPPEKILLAALNSEWKEALWAGWLQAAEGCRDSAWMAAMAEIAVKEAEGRKVMAAIGWGNIARYIALEKLEALGQASITPLVNELNSKHPLFALLATHARPWSEKLSRSVMGSLRRQAGNSSDWQLPRALPTFAMCIPPALADEFCAAWPEKLNGWDTWVDQFCALLRFRQEMTAALSHSNSRH